jgi:hypothetical protein
MSITVMLSERQVRRKGSAAPTPAVANEPPATLSDTRNRHRRADPKVTTIIASAVTTGAITALNWLSQDSDSSLRWWQLPALSGAMLLTGWIVISQSGAALKKVKLAWSRLP